MTEQERVHFQTYKTKFLPYTECKNNCQLIIPLSLCKFLKPLIPIYFQDTKYTFCQANDLE